MDGEVERFNKKNLAPGMECSDCWNAVENYVSLLKLSNVNSGRRKFTIFKKVRSTQSQRRLYLGSKF